MDFVPQTCTHDCGVAALAMAADISYFRAVMVLVEIEGWKARRGTLVRELEGALQQLGRTARRRRSYDPHTARGIVSVRRGSGWHFVALDAGMILDPAVGTLSVDDWCARTGYGLKTLLEILD